MERLSLELVSVCPSTAGQGCVWLLYLDSRLSWRRGPSFQRRRGGALLGALRKQALDERCEDGPVIAALVAPVLALIDISLINTTRDSSAELPSGSSPTSHLLPSSSPSTALIRKQRKAGGGGETERAKGRTVEVPTHLSVLG